MEAGFFRAVELTEFEKLFFSVASIAGKIFYWLIPLILMFILEVVLKVVCCDFNRIITPLNPPL